MKNFKAKEWIMVLDALVLSVLYVVEQYAPGAFETIKFLVLAWQPIVVIYIGSVAYHDVNKLREASWRAE